MRFGVFTSMGMQTWEGVLDLWRHAEATGWDVACVTDHFMPNTPEREGPMLEAWSTLSALAALVPRIRVGTIVLGNTYRHPAVVAKMAAQVDIVSGGRLLLGLGAGWQENEHEAYGIPFHTMRERLERLDEACQVMRALWTQRRSDFTGRYYRLSDAPLDPKPVQQPCPIWIASNPTERAIGAAGVERALRRVARHGDGWMTGTTRPAEFGATWDRIREYAVEAGRDAHALRSCMYYGFNVRSDPRAAVAETKEFLEAYYAPLQFPEPWLPSWAASGTREQVIEMLREYVDAGADLITLRPTSWDQEGQVRILLDEVLPALGDRAVRVPVTPAGR